MEVTMKRRLEPVDLMVAVGVLATVIGGYCLFLATSGALQAAVPESTTIARTSSIMDAMDWVQPALGQAIVDNALMEREAARMTTQAVRELNRASMGDQRIHASPFGYVDQIAAHGAAVEADHAARVQFVMGRSILVFTSRGVRTGILSPDLMGGQYNRLMIAFTEATEHQMNDAFQDTRQAHLGRMIVAGGQDYLTYSGLSQERLGRTIVNLARVQDVYQSMMEDMQGQLAAVALASIHTEQIADRFARLAAADITTKGSSVPLARPRSWPEVPLGFLFAASAALIGIFLAGLFTPAGRPEEEMGMAERKMEKAGEAYRKTA
jgi:hypothetical protein